MNRTVCGWLDEDTTLEAALDWTAGHAKYIAPPNKRRPTDRRIKVAVTVEWADKPTEDKA